MSAHRYRSRALHSMSANLYVVNRVIFADTHTTEYLVSFHTTHPEPTIPTLTVDEYRVLDSRRNDRQPSTDADPF